MGLRYFTIAAVVVFGGVAFAGIECEKAQDWANYEARKRSAYMPNSAQVQRLKLQALQSHIQNSYGRRASKDFHTNEDHQRKLAWAKGELARDQSMATIDRVAKGIDLTYGVNSNLFATKAYSASNASLLGAKHYRGYKNAMAACLSPISGTQQGQVSINMDRACDYSSGNQYVDEHFPKKKFAHVNVGKYMVDLPKRLDPNAMKSSAPYNMTVLKNIAQLGQGGGYHLFGPGISHNINVDNRNGGVPLHEVDPNRAKDRKHNSSFCSGATFAIFAQTMNDVGAFQNLDQRQLNQFKSASGGESRNFRGMWVNSGNGQVDACAIGNKHPDQRFCRSFEAMKGKDLLMPGDFVQIQRKGVEGLNGKVNAAGHSAVFLGWADKEKTKMIYWSSHGSTGGYGIKAEEMSRFASVHGTRITNPQALKGIPGKDFDDDRTPGFSEADSQLNRLYPKKGEPLDVRWRKAWLAGGDPKKALACKGYNPRQKRQDVFPIQHRAETNTPRNKSWAANFLISNGAVR